MFGRMTIALTAVILTFQVTFRFLDFGFEKLSMPGCTAFQPEQRSRLFVEQLQYEVLVAEIERGRAETHTVL
jgi:hypothetical protein